MEQERCFARRAFKYAGVVLDRGQVQTLGGYDNDEKLVRLGFFTELKPGQKLHQCGICGAEFVSDRQRTKHGERVHAGERDPEPPVMTKAQGKSVVNRMLSDPTYEPALVPDETISSQEKENEEQAPVFMDKTQASRDGGYGVGEVTTEQPSKEELDAKLSEVTPPPYDGTSPIEDLPDPGDPSDVVKVRIKEIEDQAEPDPRSAVEKPLAGKDLAKWRKKQKLTQEKAAEMLGVAVGSISRAEKLRKRPLGPKLAPALRKALGR